MRGSPLPLAALALLGSLTFAAAQQAAEEPPPATVNPNPLAGLSLDSLSATRSLPLFTPSRTAPDVEAPVEEVASAPAVPQADPEQPPPSLQLIGIVLTDSTKLALLRDLGSNEIHRLGEGDELDGWALKIVDARSVELRSGDRVEGLKMFEAFGVPPAGPMQGDPGVPQGGYMPPNALPPSDVQGVGIDPATLLPEAPPPDAPPPGAPPPDAPPPAPFAPKLGGMPIPEEGALPPEGGTNGGQ